jgi:3-dehydroquinate synthase
MPTIKIKTNNHLSEVLITSSREIVAQYYLPERTVILTDRHLQRLYHSDWQNLPVIVIPPGEKSKNLTRVQHIYRQLMQMGVNRHWTIIGFGGGVVTDIAGFCAATYLRGLNSVMVATSLLAQVDASIGGKNGVNLAGAKNIIGTIVQPQAVICPQDVLKTLPNRHFINGLAEVIKVAAIGDRALFDLLHDQQQLILQRQPGILMELVQRAVRYKAAIVAQDERECGLRRLLNFGHTFGHAIEMATGRLHGYAIATGMVWAARIAQQLSFLPEATVIELERLLQAYALPTSAKVDPPIIANLIRQDKKRRGQELHFVMLEAIGKARVVPIPINQLLELFYDLRLAG